ncbi:CGNR zinc finger domain-containing protein [Streptomyces sp. PsTaAH-124]|uniref:CGNR zinc finger domain-containing protein n=1 Tax=Streptomyces sp. PsTaAH-124 TaxID=1157638 RepID=UPI00035F8678|nr:CGNR zinc finger domain-containing protein [Streptomyces sp. PsTaAH-124]
MNAQATESPESPEPAPGLTLVSHEGKPYRFDPGALCLELLPTGGPGPFARYEVLHTPADLVTWAGRSRLADGLGLTVTEDELERTRSVRDALFLLTADRAHGRPPRGAHLDAVNEAAAAPPLVSRLTPEGTRAWASGATGAQLLSTVARDAIDLFSGPFADRVRECGAHDCFLLFVDTSRPGRRRWCAMEHCGNREKVRAHRARAARPDDRTTP